MGKTTLARQRAIGVIGPARVAKLEEKDLLVVDKVEQEKLMQRRNELEQEVKRLRAVLLQAEEPLAIYVERDSCGCEECPECGEMPVACSKTECSKTCSCSECEHCRGERALTEVKRLQQVEMFI